MQQFEDSLRAIAGNHPSGWRCYRVFQYLPGGERVACTQGETYVLLVGLALGGHLKQNKIQTFSTKRLSVFELKLASPQRGLFRVF